MSFVRNSECHLFGLYFLCARLAKNFHGNFLLFVHDTYVMRICDSPGPRMCDHPFFPGLEAKTCQAHFLTFSQKNFKKFDIVPFNESSPLTQTRTRAPIWLICSFRVPEAPKVRTTVLVHSPFLVFPAFFNSQVLFLVCTRFCFIFEVLLPLSLTITPLWVALALGRLPPSTRICWTCCRFALFPEQHALKPECLEDSVLVLWKKMIYLS